MLPEALSNGVCSLNAGTEKLTFSCLMDFDKDGHMTDYRFEKAVNRLEGAGRVQGGQPDLRGHGLPGASEKYSPVAESLQGAREAGGHSEGQRPGQGPDGT